MWNNYNSGCGCGKSQNCGWNQNNCGCNKPEKKEFICFEKKEDKCYGQKMGCGFNSQRNYFNY